MTTPTPSGLRASALAPTGRRRARRRAAALLAAGGLILGACASDDEATTAVPAVEEEVGTETETEMESEAEVDMMGAFGPACGAVPEEGAGSFAGMAEEPAATAASNNPLLSTLVTAVGEAGLGDTLNGEGPFTIFAPTNEAFEAIPTETMDMVMGDKDLLTQILTYHVVPGQSLGAEELGSEGTVETVEGSTLELGADGTTVNGVDVICSDVPTANATVHIVDEVLLPPAVQEMLAGGSATQAEDEEAMALEPSGPACSTIPAEGAGSFSGMAQDPAATAASNNPALSTLVTAVSEAGLVDTLNGEGPFTIFAPTNDAFAAVPSDQMRAVMSDQEQLTGVLTYHVVIGERLSSEQLIERGMVETAQGGQLMIEEGADGGLSINGSATSVCMDVPTANATVHLIDSVLLPS